MEGGRRGGEGREQGGRDVGGREDGGREGGRKEDVGRDVGGGMWDVHVGENNEGVKEEGGMAEGPRKEGGMWEGGRGCRREGGCTRERCGREGGREGVRDGGGTEDWMIEVGRGRR